MSLDVTLTYKKTEVFNLNITHNLNEMAKAAGIYKHLWRPEELGIKFAMFLTQPLAEGYKQLVQNPDKFENFNPPNGWGDHDGLVRFVGKYLLACIAYPEAIVSVDR